MKTRARLPCWLKPLDWLCESALNRPPVVQSANNCVGANPGSFSPRSNAQGFTVEFQHTAVSFVSVLFFLRCPPAILFRVSKVVFNSFDRVPWRRLRPHVFKEIHELQPSLTNRYSSTSVIFPFVMICIVASPAHSQPRIILRRSPVMTSRPMRGESLDCVITLKTSTRFSVSSFNVFSANNAMITTIAGTLPEIQKSIAPTTCSSTINTDDLKPEEYPSGKIAKLLVGWRLTLNNFWRHSISSLSALFSNGRSADTGGLCAFTLTSSTA